MSLRDDLRAVPYGPADGSTDAGLLWLVADRCGLACTQADRGQNPSAVASLSVAIGFLGRMTASSAERATAQDLYDRTDAYVRDANALDQGSLRAAATTADAAFAADVRAQGAAVDQANEAAERASAEAAARGQNPDLAYLGATASNKVAAAGAAVAAAANAWRWPLVGLALAVTTAAVAYLFMQAKTLKKAVVS